MDHPSGRIASMSSDLAMERKRLYKVSCESMLLATLFRSVERLMKGDHVFRLSRFVLISAINSIKKVPRLLYHDDCDIRESNGLKFGGYQLIDYNHDAHRIDLRVECREGAPYDCRGSSSQN